MEPIPDRPTERRHARREIVTINTRLYDNSDQSYHVQLLDLSILGARVLGLSKSFRSDRVGIDLQGCSRRSARVIWSDGDEVGVRFEPPLDPAEFFVAATSLDTKRT